MKRIIFVQAISLMFSMSAVPTAAQQRYAEPQPCESRAKRMVGGGVGGGFLGTAIQAVFNHGQVTWKGPAVGAIVGAASGFPNQPGCSQQKQARGQKVSRSFNDEPYPSRITPAGRRQADDSANMPTVYIRNLSGGNQEVIIGLLGPAMDRNGYSMVDRQTEQNEGGKADYVVDVALQELRQGYNNGNVGYSGNGVNVNLNPNGGQAKFIVNVTTYHNGRYARELSATGLPETVTLRGGYADIRVKGFSLGHSGETYSVDPYTMAAYQAIAETFNLH